MLFKKKKWKKIKKLTHTGSLTKGKNFVCSNLNLIGYDRTFFRSYSISPVLVASFKGKLRKVLEKSLEKESLDDKRILCVLAPCVY